MARIAPTLLVVALLAASVAAFARTALLKLEPIPITGPRVTKVLTRLHLQDEPGRCVVSAEEVRSRDGVDHRSRRSRGRNRGIRQAVSRRPGVRRLERSHQRRRDRAGRRLPAQGGAGPAGSDDRTSNPIRVDVRAPRLTLESVRPRRISPDGDGVRDGVRLGYSVSERANVALLVNGTQRACSRFRPLEGSIGWYGMINGRSVPAGRYRLELVATDVAGNRSEPTTPAPIRVRYVDLSRTKIRAAPGRQFGVRYSTDAKAVRWRLGNRSGFRVTGGSRYGRRCSPARSPSS